MSTMADEIVSVLKDIIAKHEFTLELRESELADMRGLYAHLEINADFLRDSIGECHLMISRNSGLYQIRLDWDPESLPARVSKLMLKLQDIRNIVKVAE